MIRVSSCHFFLVPVFFRTSVERRIKIIIIIVISNFSLLDYSVHDEVGVLLILRLRCLVYGKMGESWRIVRTLSELTTTPGWRKVYHDILLCMYN